MEKEQKNNTNVQNLEIHSKFMDMIEAAIRSTSHGAVTLIVQDSRVVQIEKDEKIKLC